MKEYLKLNNEVLNTYTLTGKIDREKDKEAAKVYFLEEINKQTVFFHNLKEKLDYLVEEEYYEEGFLDKYDFKFIKKIFDIAYGYKFRFPSFMSAFKFYNNYALKTRDGKNILERYEDRMAIIALYLANGDKKLAEKSIRHMMESYQTATPTTLNCGKKARGEFVSCFKLMVDDTMNSISHNIGNALQLSKLGGGVGISLIDLRCAGDPIKEIENRASGVMPVAKLLENSFSYANQLGSRAGSGVVWLNIFHGDIIDFLSAKKPNADEKIRLATLSTGIVVPDIFFELLKEDKDVYLFSPYDIYKKYGKRMSEINMSEVYYALLDDPDIRKLKKINSRKLYTEVKKTQIESGYPFEMFEDNVRKGNPLNSVGKVKILNLCTEVAQNQETSIITDYDEVDIIGEDVSCNLGSEDIHKSTKSENFGELIETSVELLTAVSDMTNISNVPSVSKGNKEMHSVGLGVMNLHGHLMDNSIQYGEAESLNFVDVYFAALNYHSLRASNNIAKKRKKTFKGFDKSTYATGEYFDWYLNNPIEIKYDVVKKALGNIEPVTVEQWQQLKKDVIEHGLYHSYRLCVAPTGSISYVRSATASISPITERVEVRDYGDSRTIYPMPFLTNENHNDYKEAYEMDMYKMIDLYATAQRHVDQALSMTLYITDDWDTEMLTRLYYYAWMKGIKSTYYVRQRMKTLEDCVACSI
ncbi:ribonucleotide-diphosphate reductase subunit alpha [Sporosarcina globispora]|uniref:Ribonucleoside-diphosphate reductase n=1 Tax=Sporosarcina globispora TaxID=1459 RepID=A0A0M0GD88_SPOGL|nr:class 1b ribonucleoside-diphosphate reductase subunit alpha [Sporosarcina globispora]KON87477.1 ribonucleotide-diphosphate reductase subunit alpha [Sporosarcina globispora]